MRRIGALIAALLLISLVSLSGKENRAEAYGVGNGDGDVFVMVCGRPFDYMDPVTRSQFDEYSGLLDRIVAPGWRGRCQESSYKGVIVYSEYPGFEKAKVSLEGGGTCTVDRSSEFDPELSFTWDGKTYRFRGCTPSGFAPGQGKQTLRIDVLFNNAWVFLAEVEYGAGSGATDEGRPVKDLRATGLYSSDPDVGVIVVDYDRPSPQARIEITVSGGSQERVVSPQSEPAVISRLTNGVQYQVSVVAITSGFRSRPRIDTATPYSHPAAVQDLAVVELSRSRQPVKALDFRPGDNRGARISRYRAACASDQIQVKILRSKSIIALSKLAPGTWRCRVQAFNRGGWGDSQAITVKIPTRRLVSDPVAATRS